MSPGSPIPPVLARNARPGRGSCSDGRSSKAPHSWLAWRRLALACLSLIGLPLISPGAPFTYQGRLVDGTALANGPYELTFRLFPVATGGMQVGSSLVLSPVTVANGLFSVELDFGSAAFPGDPRWLEIAARAVSDSNPPDTITPRQPIHPVPYALRALEGGAGDNAAALTAGILPDARLSANIPRQSDLAALSNYFAAHISSAAPPGVTAVSADPADAALVGAGWTRFSTVPAPAWAEGASGGASARSGHTAVWTGEKWLIWGGTIGGGILCTTGAAYDAAADSWTAISEIDAPTARQSYGAAWTGSRMMLWGGMGNAGVLGAGAIYDPSTADWSPLPTAAEPSARRQHVTVWTGAGMLVWGGRNPDGALSDGKIFDADPLGFTWSDLPTTGAPEARYAATGVWTGTHFVVWGGEGEFGELDSGAMLPLAGGLTPGTWTAMATTGAPTVRSHHTMVWTGSKVLIWGGQSLGSGLNDGAVFDPIANSWTPISSANAPAARWDHVAVWTGTEMVILGGQTADGPVANGAAYDPSTGTWRTLANGGSPVARSQATATWTGTELLVFGGTAAGGTPVARLQRLNPQPPWYFFRKP